MQTHTNPLRSVESNFKVFESLKATLDTADYAAVATHTEVLKSKVTQAFDAVKESVDAYVANPTTSHYNSLSASINTLQPFQDYIQELVPAVSRTLPSFFRPEDSEILTGGVTKVRDLAESAGRLAANLSQQGLSSVESADE